MLSDLGRREGRSPPPRRRRDLSRLAAARPDAFLPDLAMSLNNLGPASQRARAARGGARAAREAPGSIARSRRPARRLPARSGDVAEQPRQLTERSRAARGGARGRAGGGDIYRASPPPGPTPSCPISPVRSTTSALRSSALGRREEALAAAQEAAEISAPRRRRGPTPSCPISPRRSTTSAYGLSDLGRREEALAAARGGGRHSSRARRRAARRLPARSRRVAQQPRRPCSSALGRREEALAGRAEAVGHLSRASPPPGPTPSCPIWPCRSTTSPTA